MPIAFVLIGVETGTENEVIEELRAIDSIKDIYPVYGVYDIMIKVEAKTQHDLKEC
jgi:DNA-binding Lrp family transcriptional regulator